MTQTEAKLSRLEAIAQGLSSYNGNPCKNCGLTLKRIINYACVQCSSQYYWKNRTRELAKNKLYYSKNKEKHHTNSRRRHLMRNYNLTVEQYDEMVRLQNGQCFACSKVTKLVVDHDHETKQVRSLLCDICNMLVGLANENIAYLKKMIDYVNYINELKNAHYRKTA